MKRTIVSALKLENGTLVCKGKSGRMYSVFKKQGDLDGACATYCVIMNLLILGTINGSDTEIRAVHNNPETKRLFREFCEFHGMHRDGQTYQMIQRMLNRSMGDVVNVKRRDKKNLSSVELIAETIKEYDIPVIMSITGHAMLAVGIEEHVCSDRVITKKRYRSSDLEVIKVCKALHPRFLGEIPCNCS